MRRSKALFLAVAAFILMGTARSTVDLKVGDPMIDGRSIVPYRNVWAVSLHHKDGRVVERGISTDQVRSLEWAGRRVFSRTESETYVIAAGAVVPSSFYSVTFNLFDPKTLAPLRGEAYSSQGDTMVREFSGYRITTWMRPDTRSAEAKTEIVVPAAPFDFDGGMRGLLLSCLPLRTGLRVRFASMGDSDLEYVPVRVLGLETIHAGHLGNRKAWKVSVGSAPHDSIYWIMKRPPFVLRAVVNSEKGYASWDMLD